MKNKIFKDLTEANHRLIKVINTMPDDEKVDNKWSKKEILAHIAGWYEEGIDSIPKILKGEKPNSFKYSIDNFNKISIKKREDKSTTQIFSEMKELHNIFINKIANLNDEQLIGYYGTKLGKKQINILWIINECIVHDNNHAQELEKNTAFIYLTPEVRGFIHPPKEGVS